ncbi:Phosphocarrier protein nitrogen regulation associated [Paramagnetospirillum magnetotacticum MS-1]|uniref:Phosphocarrier protein nitrogen regulation associated n=1 Tax=Paramagnetospirillum magnetotacticum MS-1 TaxID=272627 RepID=A0A0C2U831_PARME|nr:HPr family phosphocarrier protein [Paramagnetospirillum magnetotacticum]KIL97617.1 Phosphocarrier protein nitrogen regulation associated [Paramagnetospirillum magnetotacticum MS-1]
MPDVIGTSGETGAELVRTALISNRRGLHARAAAKFVKLAATFDAQITVSHRGTEVSGLSIMGLMMLAAAPGCSIELKVTGAQATEAMDALFDLVDRKFDED